MRVGPAVATAVLLTACGGPTRTAVPSASPSPTATVTAKSAPVRTPATTGPVVVRYLIERHTRDAATAHFASTVRATLSDARGWQRGDVKLVVDSRARVVVLLGEPDEVKQLCRPYTVYRRYTGQNGLLVALNAERGRH